MSDKGIFRIVAVVGLCLVAIFIVTSVKDVAKTQVEREADLQKTEIQRKADVKRTEIEREREREIQRQKTERTEERSQFWQKLVPWGKDEAEKNENEVDEEDESIQGASSDTPVVR